jgi:hypothetical protein
MFAGLLPGNGAGTNPSIPYLLVSLYKKSRPGTPVGRIRHQGEPMAAKFEAVKIGSPDFGVCRVFPNPYRSGETPFLSYRSVYFFLSVFHLWLA